MLDTKHWTQYTEYRGQSTGHMAEDSGQWTQDTGL